jgi:phospholipid/cholesterol/gamma-HCH transport system substrate-binding protein
MVGKLLMDQKLADSVDQMVDAARQSALNLKNASTRMNETTADFQRRDFLGRAAVVLENTRQVTEQLNQAVATFTSSPPGDENAAYNLRDSIASARTAMTNLAADTEALKHNFFLRGFFNRRGYFNLDRMTPAEYRSSKFLQGHSYERIWLSNGELFSAGPGDKEELSKEGQRQIDDAMTALVPYLPNSPIVVEGYATQGSSSERFIRAQERAVAVQIYISKRFGLQPSTVGAMPMSDPIPPSVGKSVWDGVSLVLVR